MWASSHHILHLAYYPRIRGLLSYLSLLSYLFSIQAKKCAHDTISGESHSVRDPPVSLPFMQVPLHAKRNNALRAVIARVPFFMPALFIVLFAHGPFR